jgi:hypothetical protein
MIARIQSVTRRPYIAVPLALVSLVGVGTLTVLLVIPHMGREGGVTDDVGKGGGGEPPPELVAVRDSLPLYPGAAVDQSGVSTGQELVAFYWVPDEPARVMAFYERELPIQGWQPEPRSVATGEKDDGSQLTVLSTSFVKEDLLLTISASPNEKAPDRGAGYLQVLIQAR